MGVIFLFGFVAYVKIGDRMAGGRRKRNANGGILDTLRDLISS